MGHKLKQAYAKAVTFNLLSIKYHNVQYSVTPDGKIMLNEGASRSEMIVGIVSPQRPRPRRAIWLGFGISPKLLLPLQAQLLRRSLGHDGQMG